MKTLKIESDRGSDAPAVECVDCFQFMKAAIKVIREKVDFEMGIILDIHEEQIMEADRAGFSEEQIMANHDIVIDLINKGVDSDDQRWDYALVISGDTERAASTSVPPTNLLATSEVSATFAG